eukprot:ANDGO_05469.mRNA.1 hypothetical protein
MGAKACKSSERVSSPSDSQRVSRKSSQVSPFEDQDTTPHSTHSKRTISFHIEPVERTCSSRKLWGFSADGRRHSDCEHNIDPQYLYSDVMSSPIHDIPGVPSPMITGVPLNYSSAFREDHTYHFLAGMKRQLSESALLLGNASRVYDGNEPDDSVPLLLVRKPHGNRRPVRPLYGSSPGHQSSSFSTPTSAASSFSSSTDFSESLSFSSVTKRAVFARSLTPLEVEFREPVFREMDRVKQEVEQTKKKGGPTVRYAVRVRNRTSRHMTMRVMYYSQDSSKRTSEASLLPRTMVAFELRCASICGVFLSAGSVHSSLDISKYFPDLKSAEMEMLNLVIEPVLQKDDPDQHVVRAFSIPAAVAASASKTDALSRVEEEPLQRITVYSRRSPNSPHPVKLLSAKA